jgi:hypothetical protein
MIRVHPPIDTHTPPPNWYVYTPQLIHVHPLIDTHTPPNWYAYTPYPNKLRSFHFKLEYRVFDLFTSESRKQHHAPIWINTSHLPCLLIQEPAIVERRRSCPADSTAGSMNRIDNSAFERNTGCNYLWVRARACS